MQRVLWCHQSCPEIFENDQTRLPLFFFLSPLSSSENSRKESGRGTMTAPPSPPSVPPALLQSSAMSGAVGTSCGKSQTGVMSVESG